MDGTIFKCYISTEGDAIGLWYESQDARVRADMDGVLTVLEGSPRERWPESLANLAKDLEDRAESDCEGITEIILDVQDGPCCRILGFNGPGNSDFTMLYAFNKEVDASYSEPCRIAQERKANVRRDWRYARRCQFPPSGPD